MNGSGAPLQLAGRVQSAYSILVGPDAAPTERYAAGQLRHYLAQMTGARLAITANAERTPLISVGDTPFASKVAVPSRYAGDDAFRIRTLGTSLVLKGAMPRGTLFAVYAFLRRQGCWWFAPDAGPMKGHEEFVPHKAGLTLAPMDVLDQPAMRYRRQDPGTSYAPNDYAALADWMAKQGANTAVFHYRVYEANREAILQAMQLRDMRIEVGKHEIMSVFLSPKKFGRAHPDWFGLINGRRVPEQKNVVFETGNPAAVKTFAENIVAYLKQRPEIDVFQLWPPDGCRWSQSPESRALGAPSDRLARLVRQVTLAVKAAGLRTRISTIAYVQTMRPPRNMKDYSADNILEFCPIHRNYSVPFDAPQNAVFLKDLRGWLARCPGAVTEYSYYSKESWASLPVVLPRQIAADMKLWRTLGVCGVNLYNHPDNWLPLEANRDAFASAAWSSDFDGGQWYDGWLKARFGKAAGPMRRFFQSATRSLGVLIPQSMSGDPARFQAMVGQARKAMEQALKQADTPGAKWAVDKLAWQADYLADALRLRLAVYREKSGADVEAARTALRTLTEAHADDGTCESGWELRY
ncbi:MAG: DUF4838 domain-containing protein [Verrucomicrobiota bacterium]|nr:DUF4838 domain-containing protein [Verrucomicrobiota bacterium]